MNTGDVVGGRFELRQVLGEGGMGQVFKAWDTDLERFVAIKTLLPQFMSDIAAQAEMKQEVRITQRLNHPGIVAVYDYRVHERTPFIIMEFVEGQPLHHHLFKQPLHKLDERAFLAFADPILAGVAYAHDRGVVHRDLKPANIMVMPNGQVKIMDFGIAATVRATYTRVTGHTSGLTVQYSSPEQINGEDPSPSMDIYALGCVFYEMLTGHPPFYQGEVLHQQLTREPSPMPGVSPAINNAVLQCLVKSAQKRARTVADVRAALMGDQSPVPSVRWWTFAAEMPFVQDARDVTTGLAGAVAARSPWLARASRRAAAAMPLILSGIGLALLVVVGAGMLVRPPMQVPAVPTDRTAAPVQSPMGQSPDAVANPIVPEGRPVSLPTNSLVASAPRNARERTPARQTVVRADEPKVEPTSVAQPGDQLSLDLLAEIRGAFIDGRYRDGSSALAQAESMAGTTGAQRAIRQVRADMVALLLDRAASSLDSAQQDACRAAIRLDPAAARAKSCAGGGQPPEQRDDWMWR